MLYNTDHELDSAFYGRMSQQPCPLWCLVTDLVCVLIVDLGSRRPVSCLALSYDAILLIAGSSDGTVAIWDIASRQLLKTFRQHKGRRSDSQPVFATE